MGSVQMGQFFFRFCSRSHWNLNSLHCQQLLLLPLSVLPSLHHSRFLAAGGNTPCCWSHRNICWLFQTWPANGRDLPCSCTGRGWGELGWRGGCKHQQSPNCPRPPAQPSSPVPCWEAAAGILHQTARKGNRNTWLRTWINLKCALARRVQHLENAAALVCTAPSTSGAPLQQRSSLKQIFLQGLCQWT